MNKEKILGFDVCISNYTELTNNIVNDFNNNISNFIVNINPEILVKNHNNKIIKEIFNKQKYQIPDGSGIVWASKKNNGNIKTRITGIDLMLNLCKKLQMPSAKIFLYGSKEGIAEKASLELKNSFPELAIVDTCNGFEAEATVVNKINNSKATVLFVALGSPKQEQFIINNMNKLKDIKIFMPVGGSFDVISKTKKRAPKWIINLNLEWLYRLLQEPKRFFRQLSLFKFMFLIIKNKENKNGKN